MRLTSLIVFAFAWSGTESAAVASTVTKGSTTSVASTASQTAKSISIKESTFSRLTSTRGPTTFVGCQDDPTVNCAKLKPQCSDSRYNDLTNKYCAKTCNRCAGPALPTCYDSSNNCAAWNKNGFCDSTFNTTEQKKKYCEKTCGFCS